MGKEFEKELKISCKTMDHLRHEDLVPFQGRFKTRSKKDIETLAGYIMSDGFSCPFFVWSHKGKNYILDGHGRYLAIDHLRRKGVKIPDLPVIFVEADDEKSARLKVLELNNVNGEFSKEAFMDYTKALSLDYEKIHISGIDFSDVVKQLKLEASLSIENATLDEDRYDAGLGEVVVDVTDDCGLNVTVGGNTYRDVSCPHCKSTFSVCVG